LREDLEKQAPAAKTGKLTLRVRLRQAGLAWTSRFYYSTCIATAGVAVLVGLFVFGFSAIPALGFGVCAGLLLPHYYITSKRKKRFKEFTKEFPTAVDLIVRGIKSGLPVTDGLKIVAAEVQEPVRSEFKALVEDQTLGVPLDAAVERMAERMPIPSARFFAIVIAIQSRTGGNLSETLANLSKVLRERKKMEAKIKSVSSEAKASAMIIGSLPVGVAGIIYVTSPDYIMLLFTSSLGNAVMIGSAMWMLIGVLVMRKMINFDF
jgi:tight adherence protein B